MGSGKSSLGQRLASELGWDFVDMDCLVEQRCGMAVAEIFATRGEEYFRAMEREVLGELTRRSDTVVATGGGVPTRSDNMEVMNSAGLTVYLRLSPGRLVRRLENGRDKRPLIQGMDDARLLEYIERTLPGREPFYRMAKLTIDCDGAGDRYLIDHIKNCLDHTK